MSAVLITGCSSGIGAATVQWFLARGWTVYATARQPQDLPSHPQCRPLAMDVDDPASVRAAFEQVGRELPRLDAVVNNAGYGLSGSFESISEEAIRRQFETNVFGLMRVSRAALAQFRGQGGGVLVNVASMGGRLSFPFYSVYHASKWAVEGFSESLAFEAAEIGVRVKLIEPGAIRTDFYGRSAVFVHDPALSAYNAVVERSTRRMQAAGGKGSDPALVAAAIWQACTDGSERLRYPVGPDARLLLSLRRWISDRRYLRLMRRRLMR